MPPNRTDLDRFWANVDKRGPNECWEWIAARFNLRGGYGAFRADGKTFVASRWIYQQVHGVELPSNVLVLHSCDNPPCCNPDHLSLGDHRENANQAFARGLISRKGKVTEDEVREIRIAYTGQHGQVAELAKRYGLSKRNMRRIVHGHIWK